MYKTPAQYLCTAQNDLSQSINDKTLDRNGRAVMVLTAVEGLKKVDGTEQLRKEIDASIGDEVAIQGCIDELEILIKRELRKGIG
jgi:hypothetical protein